MKVAIVLSIIAALTGCDQYRATFGDTKVNEVTVYGNIRCAMPVADSKGVAISCDWDHPINGVPK